jgi:hypothetical protein
MLSDYQSCSSDVKRRRRGPMKGNQQGYEEAGDADIGAIGRILQKALQRKGVTISSNSGDNSVIAIDIHQSGLMTDKNKKIDRRTKSYKQTVNLLKN